MGHTGRGLLRTSLRLVILVLLVVNALAFLSIGNARREAVSGLLPQAAAVAQPQLLLSWHGYYPRARALIHDNTSLESIGYSGQVNGRVVAAYDPRNQSIGLGDGYSALGSELQRSVLRHEYGHALMADVVNRSCGGDYTHSRVRISQLQRLTQTSDPSNLPTELLPVFHDYLNEVRAGNLGIYGADGQTGHAPRGYYLSNLGEFFAQSFEEFCVNPANVPPATRAAFQHIETLD